MNNTDGAGGGGRAWHTAKRFFNKETWLQFDGEEEVGRGGGGGAGDMQEGSLNRVAKAEGVNG